ncbi:MAG TPA: preprotein translocase subunit TatC [Phycisphaerales bacterium]|nr:preprotein translocase subunit TatC [Phycisphaerales bacterium]
MKPDPPNLDQISFLGDSTMPLGDHLEELRTRLIFCLVGLVPFLLVSAFVGRTVLAFLTRPVREALIHAGLSPVLLATSPIEVFASYMRVVMLLTILSGSWWIVYQLWLFIRPGLYLHERRFVHILLPMSFGLTVAGTVFMYSIMLPVVLSFFINFGATLGVESPAVTKAPPDSSLVIPTIPILDGDLPDPQPGQTWINSKLMQQRTCVGLDEAGKPIVAGSPLQTEFGIAQQYRLSEYIKLILRLALAFAVGFQTPVVVLLLGWAGLVTREGLAHYRRHALLASCILGALLTPADPVSMLLLAGPLYLLFELGMILLKFMPASAIASGFGTDTPPRP